MTGERDVRSFQVVNSADGRSTMVVTGVLDAAAVNLVMTAVRAAQRDGGLVEIDLLGVTAVEGDSLRDLANALRDAGVSLETASSAAQTAANADEVPSTDRGRAS